jgi:maleylacetoacetate isomerase
MHPLNNLRVLQYLRQELHQDKDAVDDWYRHWIAAGFEALEKLIGEYGDAGHCFGDKLTLADVCLVPQVFNARRFECDLSPYPELVQVAEHLEQLEAFVKASPQNQPDAEG